MQTWLIDNAPWLIGTVIVSLVCYAAASLIYPIVFPTILTFPWEEPTAQSEACVIMAGSFNPPHKGHFAMLQYLARRHSRVVCVVGFNPNKHYAVTPDQRALLLRTMLANHPNLQVQVVEGYIWRFAKRRGCQIFYRGIRSWGKDGSDERALQILNTWGPLLLGPTWPLPTIYLEGDPQYSHISSSLIRNLIRDARSMSEARSEVTQLVPESIVDQVIEYYSVKVEGYKES
jgi:pantetheine-phosphate adenylyltransferase